MYYIKPTGLCSDILTFVRPTINYADKSSGSADAAITYQHDIATEKNAELRDKMIKQGCFQCETGAGVNDVKFNFKLDRGDKRSSLDWRQDVKGGNDYGARTLMATLAFILGYTKNDGKEHGIQITAQSITPAALKANNDKYEKEEDKWKYYEKRHDSTTIYIPPIQLYWGCFAADTKITMADGSVKAIADIHSGEKVKTFGGTADVEIVLNGYQKDLLKVETEGGHAIRVTGSHPMLTEGEHHIIAADLKIGDILVTADGSFTKVSQITTVDYDNDVYNLSLTGCDLPYMVADGLFAGDFNEQNAITKYQPTAEDIEIAERLASEFALLRTANPEPQAAPVVKGFDTADAVTPEAAKKAAQQGYSFVCRYYAGSLLPKVMSAAEAMNILNAGLSIVPVFQNWNNAPKYFSASLGTADGTAALAYASSIGQPKGTAIYFAVDYDAPDHEINGIITEYFTAVKEAVGGVYDIGVYGSGSVCTAIKDKSKLALYAWLAGSTGWSGSKGYSNWNIKQTISSSSDSDFANGLFGAWSPR